MDLIYCAGGGKVLADIAIEEGFLYGARSDDAREFPRCNGLIDINWKNYDWGRHLETVEKHRPKYAVAPDIEKNDDLDKTLSLASSLEYLCDRVIIVPKNNNLLHHIPKKYVIGISVPTSYSGFIPNPDDLTGRDVHLLGGSPKQQKMLWMQYQSLKISVISLDVNCHNKVSSFGKYWDGKRWFREGKYSLDKYDAFRRSCKGIKQMWTELGAI
ncbi:MAG TPA: DUF6610 family protein [Anaerolineales bacterium]|nr:DUF6610 family protein [Anaerolineales bacterium]